MDARIAAAKALDEVIRQGRSLNSALPRWQDKVSLRDRALLQELCFGSLRWYWRLDAIAKQLLRKPFKAKDTDVQALILVGLYQLEYLRVPDHAAVGATVAATQGLNKPWARGLVNAVLRNFQRGRENILTRLQRDPVALYAHPAWLIERLQAAYPQHWQAVLEANNQHPPMTLRVNACRSARDDYLAALAAAGYQARAFPYSDSGVVLESAVDVDLLPGFAAGDVSVQDGAAQLAALLLDAQPGERILDACAAPGGKAAHVLERQPRLAELVAVDQDGQRLERVGQTLARLNLCATLVCADAARPEVWWDGRVFDRILLDAPCSASGVMRRHPDIKLLRRDSDIAALAQLQGRILRALWPLLRPGGMLVYVTCSVLPQENVQQVQRFCAEQEDAEPVPIAAQWGREQVLGRQILPGQQGMDGFYYACLRKRAMTE
ncbi:16S rRNA methyltransferase [Candidatus Tenderia electrophaga]|jgi:16S rRNA (cytosine967-C5)-methyltransferase|uniref:16S rRNA (cytosine(967)-C(5))-methyltransferase n=1 Tax=Candidatus Tenderia electrophaga TaxID=1748243 RepID=A0A0S2TGP3_9GAMM|nr:16S rRNA methyltransferase [Candidatus Tenderia electrophaga]